MVLDQVYAVLVTCQEDEKLSYFQAFLRRLICAVLCLEASTAFVFLTSRSLSVLSSF